jgi:hypothetical protein
MMKYSTAIPVTGRGGLQGCETSRLSHCVDHRLTDDGEVVGLTRCVIEYKFICMQPYQFRRKKLLLIGLLRVWKGARGSVVVKALYYKPGGRGFDSR